MKYKQMVFSAGVILSALSLQLNAAGLTQTVTPDIDTFSVLSGDTVDFQLDYSSTAGDSTGVGVQLSFNSNKLQFIGFSNALESGLLAADKSSKADDENKDKDDSTDSTVGIAWMSVEGTWPGDGSGTSTLGVAHFKVLETSDSVTKINITGDAAAKSKFLAKPVSVTIGQGNQLQQSGGGNFAWFFLPFFVALSLFKKGMRR